MDNVTPKVTVTAHQSHWYDVIGKIMQGINLAQPVLISFLPAPVEAGIQIATEIIPKVIPQSN